MGNTKSQEPQGPEDDCMTRLTLVSLKAFKLLTVLGKGAFGRVRLVEHRQTGQKFALKYINKKKCIESKSTTNIFRERILLQDLHHSLIINLKFAFQDDANLFFVIDYAQGGDLRFHLDKNGKVDDVSLQIYVAELSSAIAYLHSQRVVHR
jgi:serine/threonine kinase 32